MNEMTSKGRMSVRMSVRVYLRSRRGWRGRSRSGDSFKFSSMTIASLRQWSQSVKLFCCVVQSAQVLRLVSDGLQSVFAAVLYDTVYLCSYSTLQFGSVSTPFSLLSPGPPSSGTLLLRTRTRRTVRSLHCP